MPTIDAYVYRADLWTPDAAAHAVASRYNVPYPDTDDPDLAIAMLATSLQIDSMDEYTYDSSNFPKPVWSDQLHPDDSIFDGRRHVLYESLL